MKRIFAILIILVIGMIIICENNQDSLINKISALELNEITVKMVSDSEIIYLKEYNDYQKIITILSLEIVDSRCISDRLIIEGYTQELKDYIIIGSKKVNVQMSIFDNEIVLGYPLINNSF